MGHCKRLTELLKKCDEIPITNSSKIILMSDCHRGDGSLADNFAPNANITYAALSQYLREGFTYIEIGDGDELWQFSNYSEIQEAHERILNLLKQFYAEGRLYMIWGNHDNLKRNPDYVDKNLSYLKGIKLYEALKLNYLNRFSIFLFHGHQADKIWGNEKRWGVNQFLMRYLWKPLELHFGIKDPTSAAKNYKRKDYVDENIYEWVKNTRQMTIAGHTHRPRFPDEKDAPYFNTGSCVHPYSITGIEIVEGKISLVKWSIQSKNDGTLHAAKDILGGPKKLL